MHVQREVNLLRISFSIGEKMDKQTVSVIIRTIGGRLDFLERAIFSIYCNSYKYKQAVIVYQGKDLEYIKKLNGFKELYPGLSFKVIQNPSNEDERAKNLNLGVANADGRFICFLDDDDVIYPSHLSELIERIRDTGKAWAYSQMCIDIEEKDYVINKEYKFTHDEFSYLKLFKDNYIPINSWMIDRNKIEDKILMFDERLKKHEDYGFLLRFAFYYEPAVSFDVTSIYKIRTDGSNTIMHRMDENHPEYKKRKQEWQDAEKIVQDIRDKLTESHYWFKEFLHSDALKQIIRKKPRGLMNLNAKMGNKRLSISLENISNAPKKKGPFRSLVSLYLFKKTGLNQAEIFFRKKIRDPLLKYGNVMTVKEDLK